MNDKARTKHLWNSFRITPDEWDIIRLHQEGVCAVCGEPQPVSAAGKRKRLATDHSHTTGEVRGLLCSRCNPILGKLENAFRRYGLHKVPGATVLSILKGLVRYIEYPPAQAALGRKVIGYPGRVGTKEHRKWAKKTAADASISQPKQ